MHKIPMTVIVAALVLQATLLALAFFAILRFS
jgi:hypothetical protein